MGLWPHANATTAPVIMEASAPWVVTYKKNQVIDEEFDRAVELAKVK